MTWLIFVSKQFPSTGKPLISTNNIHVKRALLEQIPRMKICYPRYPKSIHPMHFLYNGNRFIIKYHCNNVFHLFSRKIKDALKPHNYSGSVPS